MNLEWQATECGGERTTNLVVTGSHQKSPAVITANSRERRARVRATFVCRSLVSSTARLLLAHVARMLSGKGLECPNVRQVSLCPHKQTVPPARGPTQDRGGAHQRHVTIKRDLMGASARTSADAGPSSTTPQPQRPRKQ